MSPEILVGRALRAERGGRTVLDVDHISLRRGELLAVLGPTGAGKSTLLETLAMLEPPARGTVRFKKRSGSEAARELRRASAFVFQRPHFWREPVAYNVGLGLRLRGTAVAETNDRVARICHLLGLGHLLHADPEAISAGEAQRVALARALVLHPEILFLDEPMGNLDAATRAALRADLERVARQRATSVLLATSDAAEAFRLADRIAVLEDGRIHQIATPVELFTNPARPYAAPARGVALTLRGRVARAEGRTLEVDVGGARLVAIGDAGEGAHVKVAYRPEDLVLAPPELPSGRTSARNVLFATVAESRTLDGLVRLRLDGPPALAAVMTPAAAAELGIARGARVSVRLNPTALRAFPAVREAGSEVEGDAVPRPGSGRPTGDGDERAGDRARGGEPVRVLVIEDDPDSALGLAELLELDGFEVGVAHDAEAGLELARANRPHIVVCDIMLRGEWDGYDVARVLRDSPECASARLVALTGRGGEEDRRRALEAGFDDHVPKPFDPGRLGARLRSLLET